MEFIIIGAKVKHWVHKIGYFPDIMTPSNLMPTDNLTIESFELVQYATTMKIIFLFQIIVQKENTAG